MGTIGQASLISRGARVQFAIGVALISVIPLLVFWYFNVIAGVPDNAFGLQSIMMVALVTAVAAAGYAILQKYPMNIIRLRGFLEQVIGGDLPEQVQLLDAEDDIAAVERCLNLILKQLKERLGELFNISPAVFI